MVLLTHTQEMEPAVLAARLLMPPSRFHQKFPRDSPDVSFLRNPANGNYALQKKVDLTQKIVFHDGRIRRDSERTPLGSITLIDNPDVCPVKKRRLGFVPVRKKFDWPPRNLVLDFHKTSQNNSSTECEEVSSSVITAAVEESVQLAAHEEGSNEFNGVASENQDTDPAKGPGAEFPKTPPVTSNECQVVNDKNLSVNHSKPPDGIHNPDMLEQSSNKSPTESRDPAIKAMAKNLAVDGSVARDAMIKPSINEVVLGPCVHPSSEEIPTVVQEFTGEMDSKSSKRKNNRNQRSAAVKRTRREAADSGVTQVTSFAQLTGGEVTVNSKCGNDRGLRTAPSGLVQSVGHSERPVSIGGVGDGCVPTDADFLAHSKSLCGSYGCAADVSTIAERSQFLNYAAEGSKISGDTPQICYPEVIQYSASYLRSLVPYRPEGFNNYPHMKFKCVFCSQLFPCLDDLQGHVDQRHYGSNPYECPFCLERFDRIATYSAHLNQHVQLRNYPTFGCQVCSASFSSMWELHLHAIAHGHHFQHVPLP